MGTENSNGLENTQFEPSQIEMLAASLRFSNSDIDNSMGALAQLLQSISPDACKITRRKHGLISKQTTLEQISLNLGDLLFTVARANRANSVMFSVAKIVRGITIKTEEIAMEEWSRKLAEELSKEAEQSEKSRLALVKILGLN